MLKSILVPLCIAAFCYPSPAKAANLLWNAPDGGAWSEAANWTPAESPNSADDTVRFGPVTPGAVITNDIPALLINSNLVMKSTNITDFSGYTLTCKWFEVQGFGAATNALTNAVLFLTNGTLVVTGQMSLGVGPFVEARLTTSPDFAIRLGLGTAVTARASMKVGENTGANPSHNLSFLTAAGPFTGYLSKLILSYRTASTTGISYGELDLSSVTAPGVLDISESLEISNTHRTHGAAVKLSDSLDLVVGSPAQRGKVIIAQGKTGSAYTKSSLTLGAGRIDAYLSELTLANPSAVGMGQLFASNATGVIDVSGTVLVGDGGSAGILILGDGVDLKIGRADGPRGNLIVGRSSHSFTEDSLWLGTGRFEAYLTNLTVGVKGNGYNISNKKLFAGNVQTGLLDVSSAVIVGQGRNETYGSSLILNSRFITRIGSATNRALLYVGEGYQPGICRLAAGGTFTCYLTNLTVGRSSGYTNVDKTDALLNLLDVTNGLIDVNGPVVIGIGTNSAGEIRLPAFPAVAGTLQVGGSNYLSKATLLMTGTVFAVTNSVAVHGPTAANRGRILTTVAGAPAGLDLASDATLSVQLGVISNLFLNPTAYAPVYWGLRWAGDHTNDLETLRGAGKLVWNATSVTDAAVSGPIRIFMQDNVTYLGAPMRRRGGTVLLVR